MKIRTQLILTFTLFLGCLKIPAFSQSFEGSITYKLEVLNPDPEKFPDSLWKQEVTNKFGNKGYIVQKYYYQLGQYISEIDAGNEKGYQAYNPKDKLLYAWQVGSDSAITIDSRKSIDQLTEIVDSKQKDTIMGIVCSSIILKSAFGEMTLWYNPSRFKMDATLFNEHAYGHWYQILKKIGCLPLKMEQKSFFSHVVQTAIEYNEARIDPKIFIIPAFKHITPNPIN